MKKKVSLYCNVGHFTEIYEIQLEIAQQHLDRGDSVEFLFCDGLIPICEINIQKDLDTCLYCIGRRNSGISLLKGKVIKKNLFQYSNLQVWKEVRRLKTTFKNLESLTSYKIDNFSIGASVYSSIADINREHSPDLKKYKGEINKFIKAAGRVYFCIQNYIENNKPDIVYIYNGRHALERPAVEACRKLNIDFKTYEFAYNGGYRIQNNTLIQDIDGRIKEFHAITKGVSEDLIRKAGKIFYEKKIGLRQGAISFNKKNLKFKKNKYEALDRYEKKKILPKEWNCEKYNIVIFQSSGFEDHTANEFFKHRKIYPNQECGLKLMSRECYERDKSIHLFIKLHPSYMFWNVKPQELTSVLKLDLPENVTFILPDSKFDTYHLIENADKVVAFRSTAGIEAAYSGKPVIMLEDHIIAKLKSTYLPKDHEDAISLICDKKLPALPIDDALKYGYYNLFQGIIPKYYSRNPNKSYEANWGLYRGRKVIPSALILLLIDRFIHNQKLLFIISKIQSLEKFIYKVLYKFN